MKRILIAVTVLLLTTCGVSEWEKAQNDGGIEAYKNYIESNPEGEFVKLAQLKIDSLTLLNEEFDWNITVKKNTLESYESYLSKYPKGNNSKEAQKQYDKLLFTMSDSLFWDTVVTANTYQRYDEYCRRFFNGSHIEEAKNKRMETGINKIKAEYNRVFDFFENIDKYEDYLAKNSTINSEKVTFPIDSDFHKEQGLWELVNNKDILKKEFGNFCSGDKYDGEIDFDIYENIFDLEMKIWPGGYYYTFNFKWVKKGDDVSITEMLLSLPSYM